MAGTARSSGVPGETLLYINSYKGLDLSVSSTGFRSNSLRHRALSTGLEPRFAEDFLLNTTLRRGDGEVAASVAAYFTDEQLTVLSLRETTADPAPDDVPLPAPVPLDLSLGEAVAQRRSRRIYTGDPMAADHLSALLRAAGGGTGTVQAPLRRGGTVPLAFRSAPSAGGLYPVDLYVVPLAVRSVPRGVYRYQRDPAGLKAAADAGAADAVLDAFATTEESISLSRAAVLLLLVGQPWRVMRKYGPRGMRFVLMEAGAIAQNANLAAVALGYGSVECASVYDDEMNDALGLDGVFRSYLHAVVVGYPG